MKKSYFEIFRKFFDKKNNKNSLRCFFVFTNKNQQHFLKINQF